VSLPNIASRRACASLLLAAAATLAPGIATAHGGGELAPATRPPAPPGDGASAERIIADLETRAAKDATAAKIVAAPLANAKKTLERAHGARSAGDAPHARMLDGLALELAESARDLLRASEAEQAAGATAKKAREVETQAERARALLEETQARRERAAAELAKAEAEAKEAAARAATAEEQRIETAKKGKKGGAKATNTNTKKSAGAPKPKAKKGGT